MLEWLSLAAVCLIDAMGLGEVARASRYAIEVFAVFCELRWEYFMPAAASCSGRRVRRGVDRRDQP
jgi:hypothetical protein